jgi:hypothetical protein
MLKLFYLQLKKIFIQKKKKKCGTQSDLRREKLLKDEFAKWNLKKKNDFANRKESAKDKFRPLQIWA